jgi:ATP-dependent DNA ligase
MDLPVNPTLLPMLAKRVDALPEGDSWIFEPKWDGFRTVIFRDGDEVLIQSRDEKPLNRYFPELVEDLLAHLPPRCVLDGEIVIATSHGLDFDALQLRMHPAASRVKLLSRTTPASVVFFDLLSLGDRDLRAEPFSARRHELEGALASAAPPLHITPATRDVSLASDWFHRFEGAGLDGVIAKQSAGIYEPDRRVMLKIKHERDCDCVVAGFRWHKKGDNSVGSLLLGFTTTPESSSTLAYAPASPRRSAGNWWSIWRRTGSTLWTPSLARVGGRRRRGRQSADAGWKKPLESG